VYPQTHDYRATNQATPFARTGGYNTHQWHHGSALTFAPSQRILQGHQPYREKSNSPYWLQTAASSGTSSQVLANDHRLRQLQARRCHPPRFYITTTRAKL